MATLAEIRARLLADQKKQDDAKNGVFTSQPDAFLPFWNIADGKPLNLRLLPDGGENDFFWKEREMINLVFRGIKGQSTDTVKLVVPCNEMFTKQKDSCPVLREVRTWYAANDDELTKKANQYWKKKSYLFQVLIAPGSTTVENDNAPENPIRRILVNKQIFTRIKSILLNPSIQYLPTDYEHGRDIMIVKSKNSGGFASYDESQWSMAERPLNETERAAIEQYGLFNLEEFMPKKPSDEELNAIEEMFQASVNGEAYDPQRWAKYYRPAGVHKPVEGNTVDTATIVSSVQKTVAPVQQEAVVASTPVQTTTESVAPSTPAATSTGMSAMDLLAKLNANKGQ
ncbi:ssDNA binding protein [Xanthomonas phage XaC1]|nr:ssDNA binding protein [Xanthomonas phage XaC1]